MTEGKRPIFTFEEMEYLNKNKANLQVITLLYVARDRGLTLNGSHDYCKNLILENEIYYKEYINSLRDAVLFLEDRMEIFGLSS